MEFRDTDTLSQVLEALIEYAAENGILEENTYTYRDIFGTKLMGILTPRQSQIIAKFREIQEKRSIEAATDYFYHFSQLTNYIRMDSVKKNISWTTRTKYGILNISINLSKPEKDPKEIAMQKFTFPWRTLDHKYRL